MLQRGPNCVDHAVGVVVVERRRPGRELDDDDLAQPVDVDHLAVDAERRHHTGRLVDPPLVAVVAVRRALLAVAGEPRPAGLRVAAVRVVDPVGRDDPAAACADENALAVCRNAALTFGG